MDCARLHFIGVPYSFPPPVTSFVSKGKSYNDFKCTTLVKRRSTASFTTTQQQVSYNSRCYTTSRDATSIHRPIYTILQTILKRISSQTPAGWSGCPSIKHLSRFPSPGLGSAWGAMLSIVLVQEATPPLQPLRSGILVRPCTHLPISREA